MSCELVSWKRQSFPADTLTGFRARDRCPPTQNLCRDDRLFRSRRRRAHDESRSRSLGSGPRSISAGIRQGNERSGDRQGDDGKAEHGSETSRGRARGLFEEHADLRDASAWEKPAKKPQPQKCPHTSLNFPQSPSLSNRSPLKPSPRNRLKPSPRNRRRPNVRHGSSRRHRKSANAT
jgi:hypothetical protein